MERRSCRCRDLQHHMAAPTAARPTGAAAMQRAPARDQRARSAPPPVARRPCDPRQPAWLLHGHRTARWLPRDACTRRARAETKGNTECSPQPRRAPAAGTNVAARATRTARHTEWPARPRRASVARTNLRPHAPDARCGGGGVVPSAPLARGARGAYESPGSKPTSATTGYPVATVV